MERIYKAFRFAYETKYWLDSLVSKYNENLQRQLQKGLLNNIEEGINKTYSDNLDGVALTLTLNVTTGSIIDLALDQTKNLTNEDWKTLAEEVEIQKNKIDDSTYTDATPKVYISQITLDELDNLQVRLKGDNPRVPKQAFIIKLAVYYLYKKTFC